MFPCLGPWDITEGPARRAARVDGGEHSSGQRGILQRLLELQNQGWHVKLRVYAHISPGNPTVPWYEIADPLHFERQLRSKRRTSQMALHGCGQTPYALAYLLRGGVGKVQSHVAGAFSAIVGIEGIARHEGHILLES